MARKAKQADPLQTVRQWAVLTLGAAAFFLAVCLSSAATIRPMAMLLTLLTLSSVFLFYGRLRDRVKPPVLALSLMVLMDLFSCAYAVSGKFALQELLKVMAAFCMALLLLMLVGEEKPERKAAAVLEGFCVIAGLTSIDLLSTHWISSPVLSILSCFTTAYVDVTGVEAGVRMTSVFQTPNTFAGCIGVGVLLGLGLSVSSEKPEERAAHLACLFVNALSFILTFSMGACLAIVPAFFVVLALTGKDKRTGLLILMVETLLVTALAAFPISLTSITAWTGFQPIPLLCAVGGAAALCSLDFLAGRRLAAKLAGHSKAVLCLMAAVLAGAVIFAVSAYHLTTGITLQPGETLNRSAYPEPGSYAIAAEADGDPTVIIQSQNQADTSMHTYSKLYQGPLSQAAFTVPEDSVIVWFRFSAETETRLDAVKYSGENGSGSVPLGYRLLPGFIANRLQGLWANQNAIQRFAFIGDGLKLFLRSPIVGLGLGAYGNGVNSVQSFYYFTRYAHNHCIHAMAETGLVGLALFLGLLAVSAVSIWRGRKKPLAPALGAALVFITGHSMVEVTFSHYASMALLFSVFTVISLCCGSDFPLPAWAGKKALRNGLALGICALLVVSGGLVGCNVAARNMVNRSSSLSTLEQAAALDPFEWADHMLAYVMQASGPETDGETRQKADAYAARLAQINSNTAPIYLAEYYLKTGRTEQGLEMAEQYVTYVSSDSSAWQEVFELLEEYEQDTDAYRAGAARIVGLMDTWNEENMGHIILDEQAQAFADRMRA